MTAIRGHVIFSKGIVTEGLGGKKIKKKYNKRKARSLLHCSRQFAGGTEGAPRVEITCQLRSQIRHGFPQHPLLARKPHELDWPWPRKGKTAYRAQPEKGQEGDSSVSVGMGVGSLPAQTVSAHLIIISKGKEGVVGASFFSFHNLLPARDLHTKEEELGRRGTWRQPTRIHKNMGLTRHLVATFRSCGQAFLENSVGRIENLLVSRNSFPT